MAEKTPAQSGQTTMQVDTDLVRQLATVLDDTRLTEIEVQDGERRIRVARQVQMAAAPAMPAVAAAAPAPAPAAVALPSQPAPAPAAPAADAASHPGTVKSPMVGTVYLTPEPGAAPFVTEGATVKEGDTLLIIEAMRVMNPITAPKAGRVAKVLVQSEQPVEYDTPLVIIE